MRGDAGRYRLRLDLDDLVGYDGDDVRVGQHRGPLRLVELGREATERVPEGAVGDRPLALAVGARDGRRVRVALQHHEVVARSDRPALAIDRRRASTSRRSLGPGGPRGRRQAASGSPPCSGLASGRPMRRVRRTAPSISASDQASPAAPGSRPGRLATGSTAGDGSAAATTDTPESEISAARARAQIRRNPISGLDASPVEATRPRL